MNIWAAAVVLVCVAQSVTETRACYAKTHLLFIMDESSCVNSYNFNQMKKFVNDMIQHFTVGPSYTRVSVITFANSARLDFNFNRYRNCQEVRNAVSRLAYSGGATNTHIALKLARESAFTTANGYRTGGLKTVILVTGGKSASKANTIHEGIKLRQAGIKVITVGVTTVDRDELIAVSAIPNHFIPVSHFNTLCSKVRAITNIACQDIKCGSCKVNYNNACRTVASLIPASLLRQSDEMRKADVQMDLVVAIEANPTIVDGNRLNQIKASVLRLVNYFTISSSKTQVAFISWGVASSVYSTFNAGTQNSANAKAILDMVTVSSKLKAPQHKYNYGQAMRIARTQIFQTKAGSRSNVKRVLLIIGRAQFDNTDMYALKNEANLLTKESKALVNFAITNTVTSQTMLFIRRMVYAEYIWLVESVASLPTYIPRITKSIENDAKCQANGFFKSKTQCSAMNPCEIQSCSSGSTCVKKSSYDWTCKCSGSTDHYDDILGCLINKKLTFHFLVDTSSRTTAAGLANIKIFLTRIIQSYYISSNVAVTINLFSYNNVLTVHSASSTHARPYDAINANIQSLSIKPNTEPNFYGLLTLWKQHYFQRFSRSGVPTVLFILTSGFSEPAYTSSGYTLLQELQTLGVIFHTLHTTSQKNDNFMGPLTIVGPSVQVTTTTQTIISSVNAVCRRGYYYSPTARKCQDYNECSNPKVCPDGASCSNRAGGFACSCPTGMSLVPDQGCKVATKLDMVFMLDLSNPVALVKFRTMIFGMIDRFYIHANYVRIYVVTFGGNNYLKAISITGQSSIAYLTNLRPVTGTPDLGLVLQYVTTRIFQNTQYVRTDAKNNLFLLTSGVTNLQNVVILNQYINILHSMNIYMPVFYVPGASGVQMSVLNDIAYPTPITTVTTSTTVTQITTIVTTTITYISKTMSCNRGYVYVAQRNRCEDINECASPVKPCLGGTCANTAGSFTCSCAPSLQFVAGAGCVNKKQTDVVIAIDSSVPTDKLNKLKQYAIGFVERQFVDPNVIRVAIVDFSSSVRIQQTLKQTTNLDSTLTKIQQISRRTGTPNLLSLLQTLQNSILKSTNGFRPAAKTLVLILSGGSSVPNQGTTVKTVVNNIKETTGAVIPIITTGPISSGNRPMFDEISWPMRSNDVTTKPVTTTSIITTVTTIVTDVVQTLNCQKGYQAVNGKCVDINECSRNPCNRFQKCVNKNGGYSCDDINECARKPSPCHSVYEKCVNKPGGYTCVDINECNANPCNAKYQKCVNKVHGHNCVAIKGCDVKPCKGSMAKCVNKPRSAERTCNCNPGFNYDENTGCVDINECARKVSPCHSVYEKCVNKPGGYTCVDINECKTNPCNAKYQKCVNKVHGYSCVDIDECTEKRHNCNLKVATCVNESPGFKCVDIDECKKNPCKSYETCVNKNPGYSCVAIKGCDVKPCKGSMAKCVNKPRSAERTCNCNPGFNYDENTGCVDIDECKKNPCKSYETCVNKNPGYSCVAIKGCDVKPCKGSMVKCVNRPRSAERTCNCNPGFNYDENTGCVDIDECKKNPCKSYETCVNKNPGYSCVAIKGCDVKPCKGSMVKCVNRPRSAERTCNCNPGFNYDENTGCVDINECARKPSPCHGVYEKCVNKPGGYTCVAIKGCDVKPCKGLMAKCVNKPRSAERTCNCNPGFNYDENTGCVDVDECKTLKVPCKGMPTSTCHNTPGSHTCKCPTSFKYDAQIGCLATKKIDIAIVIDVTSAPNVVKAKKFVENIVTSVYVHPDSAHVAIVPFSSVVLPGLPLKSGIAPKTVTTFANGVAPGTGQSNVYKALKYLKTDTFTAGNGARPQIPRAVFLITDGQLNPKLRDEIIVQINILTQQNIPINVVTTDTTNIDQDMIDIINYPALAPTDLGTINVNEIVNVVNNVVVNVVKVIQCGPGFKSVNNKCQDINECDRRPSVCLQAGTCKNTVGSYVCQCAADQIYDSHVGCQAKQPIDVVFLVDVSPMSSPAAITKARESIVTMIKKLYINPSFARVAIVTFADASVATLSSLMTTTNYDSVALAVNQITRRGSSSTPIAQVLKHVKDVIKLQFRSNSHKMVFYLTGQVFTSQQNQINTRLIENFKQTESITFIVTSIMPRPSASGPSSSVQQDPLPQPNRIIIYEDTSASTIWGIMIWVIRSINCNRGQYFNNGRCQDINECQYGACGAGVQCTNRAPGFTCSCPSGQIYSPESRCVINKPVDIAFMLDASSAVTREQFQKAVSFVGQSLSKIKISNNAARVLISTIYGVSGNRQSLTLAQLWGRQGDNAYVESTLSQLKYNGGPSKGVLAKILSSAYTLLPAGNRPKIVVVVGAGMYPNDGSVLQGLYDAMGVLNGGIRFFGVTFDKSKAAEMLYSHISYRNLFNPSAAEVTTWISDIIINTQCPNGQVRVGNKCQGLNECQKFKPCGVSSQRVCTDKPIGFACSCKSGVMDPFKICTSSSNSNSVGGSSSFRCISGITQKVYKDGDRWTDVCVNYRCDASQRKAVLESFQCNTGTNAKPVCVANGSTNPRGDQTCTCTATRSGDRISHSLECYYSNNFYASLGR